jgi:hypothetical protein
VAYAGDGPMPWAKNFTVKATPNIGLAGTDKLLVGFNASRVAIFFSIQFSGATVWINPGGAAIVGQSFVANSTSRMDFNFAQHGGLVQQEWHAITNGAGGTVSVLEVLWTTTQEDG